LAGVFELTIPLLKPSQEVSQEVSLKKPSQEISFKKSPQLVLCPANAEKKIIYSLKMKIIILNL
jgi:hypothetical protein